MASIVQSQEEDVRTTTWPWKNRESSVDLSTFIEHKVLEVLCKHNLIETAPSLPLIQSHKKLYVYTSAIPHSTFVWRCGACNQPHMMDVRKPCEFWPGWRHEFVGKCSQCSINNEVSPAIPRVAGWIAVDEPFVELVQRLDVALAMAQYNATSRDAPFSKTIIHSCDYSRALPLLHKWLEAYGANAIQLESFSNLNDTGKMVVGVRVQLTLPTIVQLTLPTVA